MPDDTIRINRDEIYKDRTYEDGVVVHDDDGMHVVTYPAVPSPHGGFSLHELSKSGYAAFLIDNGEGYIEVRIPFPMVYLMAEEAKKFEAEGNQDETR